MKTKPILQQLFQQFLECGAYSTPPGRAVCALHSARTLIEWKKAEAAGLVRLQIEPEEESYFRYGVPDDWHEVKKIERLVEAWGLWIVNTEFRATLNDNWQHADSVGMCLFKKPADPFDNPYVIDLMHSALMGLECNRTSFSI